MELNPTLKYDVGFMEIFIKIAQTEGKELIHEINDKKTREKYVNQLRKEGFEVFVLDEENKIHIKL